MSEANFDTASKTYVRFVLDELMLSPTALAKKAGIAATTLTRALNDPTHKFNLSMTTLEKIAKASGISPQPFFAAKDFADLSMIPYAAHDLYNESWGAGANADGHELLVSDSSSTIVIGETAAGLWKAPELADVETHGTVLLTVPNVRKVDAFALRVGDESGAPFLNPGEYAVCVRRRALKWTLGHGDLVVVERWINNRQLMELTIRRVVEVANAKPVLRFDNLNAKLKEELQVSESFDDTEDLKIIGAVRYAVRDINDPTLDEEIRRRNLIRMQVAE